MLADIKDVSPPAGLSTGANSAPRPPHSGYGRGAKARRRVNVYSSEIGVVV